MYTVEGIKAMSPFQFSDIIDTLSPEDMRYIACFMCGAAPEAFAMAMNGVERIRVSAAARK